MEKTGPEPPRPHRDVALAALWANAYGEIILEVYVHASQIKQMKDQIVKGTATVLGWRPGQTQRFQLSLQKNAKIGVSTLFVRCAQLGEIAGSERIDHDLKPQHLKPSHPYGMAVPHSKNPERITGSNTCIKTINQDNLPLTSEFVCEIIINEILFRIAE